MKNKKKKNRRKKKLIIVDENSLIGFGGYGHVYRISPRRIVKVFIERTKTIEKFLIRDEIRGARKYKFGLPILDTVEVLLKGREEIHFGIIKRFIPNPIDENEFNKLCNEIDLDQTYIDAHSDNYRKDSRGRLYLIDTQTLDGLID